MLSFLNEVGRYVTQIRLKMEIHHPMMLNRITKRALNQCCAITSLAFLLLVSNTAFAGDTERQQAKCIHDRLTGIPPTNSTLDAMETMLIDDPTGETAAFEALNNPAFYNDK